ncbi:MAG: VOC family protein, partial [Caulobacteraceae bacterium]
MRYLHTMVRVSDLEAALDFYCAKLGLDEVSRHDNPAGRFTLVFLAAPGDAQAVKSQNAPAVELTYNWDPETYSG